MIQKKTFCFKITHYIKREAKIENHTIYVKIGLNVKQQMYIKKKKILCPKLKKNLFKQAKVYHFGAIVTEGEPCHVMDKNIDKVRTMIILCISF